MECMMTPWGAGGGGGVLREQGSSSWVSGHVIHLPMGQDKVYGLVPVSPSTTASHLLVAISTTSDLPLQQDPHSLLHFAKSLT